jgi:transcription termination factor NusB
MTAKAANKALAKGVITPAELKAMRLERLKSAEKVREEVVNAVRKTISDEGINTKEIAAAIKKHAAEAAENGIRKHLNEESLRKITNEALNRVIQEVVPKKEQLEKMIHAELTKHISIMAADFIRKNVDVMVMGVPTGVPVTEGGTW